MSDFPDLTAPWSMVPLVNEDTYLFPTPTMDALSATYGRGVSVLAFGATGNGVTNDRAAIQAALDSVPEGGGMVFFPNPPDFYALDGGSLDIPNGVTLAGESSTRTQVRMVGAYPLFNLTELRREVVFRNLSFETAGGHIFELGSAGGLSLAAFTDSRFITYAAAASVFHQDGTGDFVGVRFRNCDFIRFSDSTVPGFDMRNTSGAWNGNTFESSRVTSNGATGGGRYWKIRADASGTYADQNTFRDIIGQLNPGGLIEFDSPGMLTLENVIDYDVPGAYSASLVKIGKAAGGYPGSLRASMVGNRGGTMNGTTVFQLEISAATTLPAIIDRVCDHIQRSYVSFAGGYGATQMSASGASMVLTASTGSKTLDPTAEGVVVFNGSSLTATLPDPTTIPSGRSFVVKNVHSSSLTVASAGTSKTIDGVASKSLAQWASGRYVSDGTQWLTA